METTELEVIEEAGKRDALEWCTIDAQRREEVLAHYDALEFDQHEFRDYSTLPTSCTAHLEPDAA